MEFDSDVAIIGTGLAPLVAASHLLSKGKRVLVLNPDWDFFREESELPFEPFWPVTPETLNPQLLLRNRPERALDILRPDFPGAVEFWSSTSSSAGKPAGGDAASKSSFHDELAPHVRGRSRLWIRSDRLMRDVTRDDYWETLEDIYVESSDAGLNPQVLEGVLAARRFPGFSGKAPDHLKGILIPNLCDVDVSRYRAGLLEYVRDRLGPQRVLCDVAQIEMIPEGIRFHSAQAGGNAGLGASPVKTARLTDGLLVFWTPRLHQWVSYQVNSRLKRGDTPPLKPKGIRFWEQWLLTSKETLDPGTIGVFEDMAVWCEFEGVPSEHPERKMYLSVLRAGPLLPVDQAGGPKVGSTLCSTESFDSISRLCHEFLGWDKFTVRSLRSRAVFEWERHASRTGVTRVWPLSDESPRAYVVSACDGPVVNVVRNSRHAAEVFS